MSSPQPHSSGTMPDLSACEREPIHIPSAIEPNGVLLVLEEPQLRIVQASASTTSLLGVEAEKLLGTPLADIFEEQSLRALQTRILPKDIGGKRRNLNNVRLLRTTGVFDALVHRQSGLLIVELEPVPKGNEETSENDLHTTLTNAMIDVDDHLSLADLCQRVAAHIRTLTGFHRVMVYRFLEDDSGSVIAEDKRPDLISYLGLRYPASDIPAQARRLYLLNTLRLKADAEAPSAPMIPAINPITKQPLDMTHCMLRAMSPVHNEYLRNMGVRASMSISIVKDDRLWGLIACHHDKPCAVHYRVRTGCDVLARVFAAHIADAEQQDARAYIDTLGKYRDQLAARLQQTSNVRSALVTRDELLYSVIHAHGAAICLDGEISVLGAAPPLSFLEGLVAWLKTTQKDYILQTDKLPQLYSEAEAFADTASGLLSARIASSGADFILWFRPAAVHVIDWAGNPDKPVDETEAGKRISPRRSFEAWKQTVADRSDAWQDHEVGFASAVRRVIAEALLVARNEEVMRLNLELERSNIELDAFAYAASHDLQEPVRTIKAFAQLLARRAGPKLEQNERELINVIEIGADRMGNLISALLTYGQVGGGKRRERKTVNLEDVLRWVLLNLDETIRGSGARVTHDRLPTVTADPDQMMQLLQNLVANSIKYRKAEEASVVHISVAEHDDSWRIAVEDNGQGFEPESAELIFGAFKRLHGREIPGVGIGLALCKRIVEHHGGRIWAESPGRGQGATLTFTLPQ